MVSVNIVIYCPLIERYGKDNTITLPWDSILREKQTTMKQLTKQQVIKIFTNKSYLNNWENKFINQLKDNKFMITKKQGKIISDIIMKIDNTNTNYVGGIHKNYNIDYWVKIENNH